MLCIENTPLQVHQEEGSTKYSIGALDSASGAYKPLYNGSEMAWTDGKHINAVSQWTSSTDEHFAFASVTEPNADSLLCRINVHGEDCFPNGTLAVKANAGAVVGDNYYYGQNIGRDDSDTMSIYYVSGLDKLNPTFHTDKKFLVHGGGSLFQGKILDLRLSRSRTASTH